jgi:hypothetical protein
VLQKEGLHGSPKRVIISNLLCGSISRKVCAHGWRRWF